MRNLTLTPDKKTTTIDVHASAAERQEIGKMIKKIREKIIFDIDAERMKRNKSAIQGPTDPLTYIKIDNFFKELGKALTSEAVSAQLGLEPNEFSKESGDPTTNRIYTKTLKKMLNRFVETLTQEQDKGLWRESDFQVRAIYDLAQVEGFTSGEDFSKALKKGKTIPEYGTTELPPADRFFGLKGSTKVLVNRSFVVIVQDDSEEGLTQDPQVPIKLKNYGELVKRKKIRIAGVGPTTLNAYREIKSLKPKTRLELLQMGVAFTVGISESIMAPRPIMKPQILPLRDPDTPGQEKRNYYAFVIGGYSGVRGAAERVGTESAMTDIQSMPEVED